MGINYSFLIYLLDDIEAYLTSLVIHIVVGNRLTFLHQRAEGIIRPTSISHMSFLLIYICCISLVYFHDARHTEKIGNTIALDFLV